MLFIKIIILLIGFLIKEIKLFRIKVVNFFVYFKDFKALQLCLENFSPNKNCKIFRIEDANNFINYIRKNIKKHHTQEISKNKIFVESFINHPIYTIKSCIIANATSKILKIKCCGILRKGDLKSKTIFNSYGIHDIIYINQGNLFSRFCNLIIAFKLLKNIRSIDSLIKLKLSNIEIGRAVYEQYLRFVKNPATTNIVKDFYYFFYEALILNNQFKKIFKKNKNSYLIQAETQYYPYTLCMQNALQFNCKMIARRGLSKMGLKIFTKKEKNMKESRLRPTKKIFNLISKELNKKNINKYILNSSKYFDMDMGKEIYQRLNIKNLKKFNSKKDVCEYFNIEKKKPIILILAHELSDGNFKDTWNLFNNDLIWLEETIDKIKKNTNVNWIINSHPSENVFKNKVKTKNVYERLAKNYDNIKLFPATHDIENFHKFISVAISSHGTSGLQYPLRSIPTIICGESTASGFGFNIEPKTKREYFNTLSKIHTIKKLDYKTVKRCFTFNYLYKYASLEPMPTLFETDVTMQYNQKEFWKKMYKSTKKDGIKFDSFLKSLKFLLYNNYHYYLNLKRFDQLKKSS
jgi:hypothetical protein